MSSFIVYVETTCYVIIAKPSLSMYNLNPTLAVQLFDLQLSTLMFLNELFLLFLERC